MRLPKRPAIIIATLLALLQNSPQLPFSPAVQAVQGTPYIINFQGRLADSTGNVLANGSYNIKFRIFNAPSGGTNLWQADRVAGASDHRVVVTNGLFSVQLGDSSQGDPALGPGVFASSTQLYLEVELPSVATNTCGTNGCASFTEGPFTPRQPLATSPYAYNSDTLDGIDSDGFVQLSPSAQQTGNINISGNLQAGGSLQGTSATITGVGGLTLGTSSSIDGKIVFRNGTNANTVTLQSGATGPSSFALTLPTAPGATGDCLKDSNGAGVLVFGSCSGATVTLQDTYTNSASPATMSLNTSAKDFVITATDQATDPNVLINLTCATCSGGGGRFAAQDNGTDIFTVNPDGSIVFAPTSSQNVTVNLPAASQFSISSATAPTVSQAVIDNTGSSGVTTANISALNLKYKGGAAAVEAQGMRIDYTPGTTSGGIWSGMRIVAGTTGAVAGVTEYGLKLEGPTTPGAGQETGVQVATGWDIGVDVQSGGLQLAAQTDPATPAAGNLRIYAKDIAGRIMPKWIGPAGVDTPFQAGLGFNRVAMIMPAGGTTLTTFVGGFGTAFTNTGTANNPAPASTNHLTSVRRATFSTGATAGTVSSHRQSTLQVWRGNAAGRGGFFYTIRFGTSTLAAGNRAFVGLSDVTTAPTNVDPTTNTTPGKVGLAINTNTGNWNLVNNITGTAPTVTPLGASFPVNTTDLYELVLYAAPNGTAINYRVQNITTAATTSGSLTTNIPANTTFMSPNFWITNNATAAAAIIDFSGWYLESDN